MSSNVFVETSTLFSAAVAAPVAVKAVPRPRTFAGFDLPFVLPLLAALLLIVGFGIVAEPLVVKDLPLLAGTSLSAPPHVAP